MATPNYGYEKRQKELAKKRKKEDKLRAQSERKSDGSGGPEAGQDAQSSTDLPEPSAVPAEPGQS